MIEINVFWFAVSLEVYWFVSVRVCTAFLIGAFYEGMVCMAAGKQ